MTFVTLGVNPPGHNKANTISLPIFEEGLISSRSGFGWGLLYPGTDGILYMLLIGVSIVVVTHS
jgi:hypothetical protein